VDEFRTLNRCLDDAIAGAVTEFAYQHDLGLAEQQADASNHQLGYFAHELRNQLSVATLALSVTREGGVGLTGATGAVLDQSLLRPSSLRSTCRGTSSTDPGKRKPRRAAGFSRRPVRRRRQACACTIE
jgi:hypothetical protein